MFKSFTIRIFASVLAAALLSIGCTVYFGLRAMEQGQELDVRERMISEASLASELCRLNGGDAAKVADYFATKGHKELRLTIVDSKGDVVFDSMRKDTGESLDNHADRPEIIEAAREGSGFSMRDSGTLSETLVYAAVSMGDGSILRLAVPMSEVRHVLWSRSEMLLRTGLLAAFLSALFAVLVSLSLKKSFQPMIHVVKDIASGHLERRISAYPGKEFAPLAEAVNSMAHSIEEQLKTQADQTAQLETILNAMSDGVLVLGQKGHIRRCNRAMERSFPAISSSNLNWSGEIRIAD
ncbi:MAG: HAMP domain-containing protein [Desulfovibrionaceae bacterium]|nr:HAMP domain-containing protein [Desulfovibrionaceae bacterium]